MNYDWLVYKDGQQNPTLITTAITHQHKQQPYRADQTLRSYSDGWARSIMINPVAWIEEGSGKYRQYLRRCSNTRASLPPEALQIVAGLYLITSTLPNLTANLTTTAANIDVLVRTDLSLAGQKPEQFTNS
jgi:hypothetical protein